MCKMCKREHRPLVVIAADIRKHWSNTSPYAAPYLNAMASLTCIEENYYMETGQANAQGWRGEDARRIKKELNELANWKAM